MTKHKIVVDCYRLVARDGLPPHPEDEPVKSLVAEDAAHIEQIKKALKEEFPGAWIMERPHDVV